jgi:SSS family solute:Na+ symporter
MLLAEQTGGLTIVDGVVVGLYLAAMLAMGFVIARRNASTDDFFVGGRNLPSWAVGISLIASLLSTITYLGMPGEMFRTGIGFLTRQLGIPVVLLIVWFVWIPFFMRLNLTSAYEYLERRFNYATRALAAVFCICLLLGWIAVVVLTASGAMAEIANLRLDWFFSRNSDDADLHALILGMGLFSIVYTTLGGLRAVVWTDVVQFFVLLIGAVFTMAAVAVETQTGLGDWLEFSRGYKHEQVEWFSWDVANRSTVFSISIGMLFWHACTHGANQVALQRYFAVKDIWAARRSFLVNALSSIGLGILLAGVGLSLMYFVLGSEQAGGEMLQTRAALLPDLENAAPDEISGLNSARTNAQKNVFPQFIRLYLPSGLRGLVVAALFAAAMSTIDSGANSISTIVTVDFVRPVRATSLTKRDELRLARGLTASMGVIVVVTTIALHHVSKGTNIIDLCQRGFNCFLGPLGALFVLAMFSRRATPRTVIPALLIGEIVGIGSSYSQEVSTLLVGMSQPFTFSTHLVVPTAWLATMVTSLVLSAVFREEATAEQQHWMWRRVVGEPVMADSDASRRGLAESGDA